MRAAHLDLDTNPVAEKHCNLFGWVEAGHASAKLLRNANHFVARCRYIYLENRIVDNDGKLDSVVLLVYTDLLPLVYVTTYIQRKGSSQRDS